MQNCHNLLVMLADMFTFDQAWSTAKNNENQSKRQHILICGSMENIFK